LALHLRPCETKRFELADTLGIGTLASLTCLAFFLFSFFHALGEAGLRVDEAFSGITHAIDYSMPAA
jgi:hypothetical protein